MLMPINLLLLLCLLLLLRLVCLALPVSGCYSAIYSFGDSLTDTGNLVYFSGTEPANYHPYGETYFRRPSGRYSDGRIVLDFIAQTVGLPLVPPYAAGKKGDAEDFGHGANFAVAGASALSNDFFEAMGFSISWEHYSLATQLQWFQQLVVSSSASLPAPNDTVSSALFFVGEIGVNDYNILLSSGNLSIDFLNILAPSVVRAIGSAADELMRMGAKTVIVGGLFPMGCIPLFLTKFQTQNSGAYEPETGCLKSLNELSRYHNLLLKHELSRLRESHPRSTVIYADYYETLMPIYRSPNQFGMKPPLAACCGGEGPYNFSSSVRCSDPESKWCSDPSSYVCWDGMHLTEAASHEIARGILLDADFDSAQQCGCLTKCQGREEACVGCRSSNMLRQFQIGSGAGNLATANEQTTCGRI